MNTDLSPDSHPSKAAETIQAAIDKLTGQRAKGTPAPWASGFRGNVETAPENPEDRFDVMSETIARVELYEDDGDLIVLLHRTIDAQLAVLQAASNDEYECALEWAEIGKPHLRGPAKVVPINRAALALAVAILGDPE